MESRRVILKRALVERALELLLCSRSELYDADCILYDAIMSLSRAKGYYLVDKQAPGLDITMPEKKVVKLRENTENIIKTINEATHKITAYSEYSNKTESRTRMTDEYVESLRNRELLPVIKEATGSIKPVTKLTKKQFERIIKRKIEITPVPGIPRPRPISKIIEVLKKKGVTISPVPAALLPVVPKVIKRKDEIKPIKPGVIPRKSESVIEGVSVTAPAAIYAPPSAMGVTGAATGVITGISSGEVPTAIYAPPGYMSGESSVVSMEAPPVAIYAPPSAMGVTGAATGVITGISSGEVPTAIYAPPGYMSGESSVVSMEAPPVAIYAPPSAMGVTGAATGVITGISSGEVPTAIYAPPGYMKDAVPVTSIDVKPIEDIAKYNAVKKMADAAIPVSSQPVKKTTVITSIKEMDLDKE